MQTIKCRDAFLLSFIVAALLLPYTHFLYPSHDLINYSATYIGYFNEKGILITLSTFLIFLVVYTIVLNKRLDKTNADLLKYKTLINSFPPIFTGRNGTSIEGNTVYEYIAALMITERQLRKSEELFRNMIENTLVGVCIFDERGNFDYANNAFGRLFEYNPAELPGKHVTEIILENQYRIAIEKRDVYADGNFPLSLEWSVRTASGKKLSVLVNSAIMSLAGSEGQKTIMFVTDITERKMMEDELLRSRAELRAAKEKAESLNEQKTRFLSSVSHEIRTPLNGIIGFTELLENESDGRERAEMLECIKTSSRELLALVNELLDLSKIEAGMVELENGEFDIEAAARESLSIIEPLAAARGVNAVCEVVGDINSAVISDRHRYKQVLINLLGNALKFTRAGFIQLTLEAKERADGLLEIETSIRDTGTGIAPGDLEKIFLPFVQAKNTGDGNAGGTGLGLSISNELVKKLGGGGISVESEPGRGSRFFFTLNLEKGKALSKPAAGGDESATEPKVAVPAGQKMRILVADDNRINLKLVEKILTDCGHSVSVAGNGREAVNAVKNESFDLILMDVNMPEMDGYRAAGLMRSLGVETPIVAMTASAMKSDIEKCEKAGMTGFISKPIDVRTFKSEIEGHSAKNPRAAESEELDLSTLKRNVKNDEAVVRECLELFFRCVEDEKKQLGCAIRDKNRVDATFIAHKIKGSALAVGASKIAGIAGIIERLPEDSFEPEAPAYFSSLCDKIRSCRKTAGEKKYL